MLNGSLEMMIAIHRVAATVVLAIIAIMEVKEDIAVEEKNQEILI